MLVEINNRLSNHEIFNKVIIIVKWMKGLDRDFSSWINCYIFIFFNYATVLYVVIWF